MSAKYLDNYCCTLAILASSNDHQCKNGDHLIKSIPNLNLNVDQQRTCSKRYATCCQSQRSTQKCDSGIANALYNQSCDIEVYEEMDINCCRVCLDGVRDQQADNCSRSTRSDFEHDHLFKSYEKCCHHTSKTISFHVLD